MIDLLPYDRQLHGETLKWGSIFGQEGGASGREPKKVPSPDSQKLLGKG
jgi:hypothetical protein